MKKISGKIFQGTLNSISENDFLICLLLSLTSISLKLLLIFMRPSINKDGALYLICAQFISEGKFNRALELFPYPLFPYLTSAVHTVTQNWVISGYALSVIPASLSVIPFYIISKHTFGKKVAIWSCIFFMLSPLPNEFFTWIGRDGIFILLSLTSISLLLLSANKPHPFKFLIPGLTLSLIASIFRIEGIAILILMGGAILFRVRKNRLSLLAVILFFVIAFSVISILPEDIKSQLRVAQLSQEISYLFKLEFLKTYRQIYAALKEMQYQLPGSRWAQNFMEIARHYMPVIYLIGLLESTVRVIFPPFVPLVIYGILKTYRERNNYRNLCLLFLIILVVTVPPIWRLITLNFLSYRYVFLPAFLLTLFAGKGWIYLYSRIKNKRTLTVLIFLIIFGSSIFYTIYRFRAMDSTIMKILPELHKTDIPGKEPFITNDPRIAFYLNLKDNFLYVIDPDPTYMEKEGMEKNARYILLTVSKKNAKDLVKRFKRYELIRQYNGTLTAIIVAEKKPQDSNTI